MAGVTGAAGKIDDMRTVRRLHLVPVDAVDTNEDLLVRAGRGDRDAFSTLYDQIASAVFGLARRVVRDQQLAQDVVQEAMVEVWRQAPRFDPDKGNAMGWIATITHRRAVDRVRSEQSRHDRELATAKNEQRTTNGDEISAGVVRDATRQELCDALGQLTDLQRQVIQLAFYDGRTYTEVAELLNIPVGTAKTRIRDGLIRLRDAVASSEGAS